MRVYDIGPQSSEYARERRYRRGSRRAVGDAVCENYVGPRFFDERSRCRAVWQNDRERKAFPVAGCKQVDKSRSRSADIGIGQHVTDLYLAFGLHFTVFFVAELIRRYCGYAHGAALERIVLKAAAGVILGDDAVALAQHPAGRILEEGRVLAYRTVGLYRGVEPSARGVQNRAVIIDGCFAGTDKRNKICDKVYRQHGCRNDVKSYAA